MFEQRRISSAYNDALGGALARVREQAAEAAAHLVVGVDVRRTEREAGGVPVVEYVVSGTAVRLAGESSTRLPHLTLLSMTECWCLRQAGYEPIGLAAATTVYFARPSPLTSQALGKRGRSAPPNQELPDLSAATVGGDREFTQPEVFQSPPHGARPWQRHPACAWTRGKPSAGERAPGRLAAVSR
jgi:hypothetical protein